MSKVTQTQLFISEKIALVATCDETIQPMTSCDGKRCMCQLVEIQLFSFAEERFDRRIVWWKNIIEPPADWLPQYVGPEILYIGPCDCLPFRFAALRKQIHEVAHKTLQKWFSENQ